MLSALKKRIWNLFPAGLRRFYSGIRCPEHRPMKMTLAEHYIYKGQEGADLIARMLEGGDPCLITRFGWNEIAVVTMSPGDGLLSRRTAGGNADRCGIFSADG